MNKSSNLYEASQAQPAPIRVGAGGVLRLAQPSDDAGIRELFDATPMRGDLVVTTDRAPNFFSLYKIQDAHTECWVVEREQSIIACASFIIRPGWLGGVRTKIAYLGDLRASPRAFGIITRYYAQILSAVQARHNVKFCFAGIMDSNVLARKALVKRREARKHQPMYHPLRRYDAINIRFGLRRPGLPRGWKVRRAQTKDLPEIASFLHEDHRHRPMGYCFDENELAHRLEHWPRFSIDQTYLAYRGSQLRGLCTVWDARDIKRYRVIAYQGKLRWLYRGSKLLAKLLNTPALPDPGRHFRYAYLSNLSIRDQDPKALRALLASIMRDQADAGYHFLMAYIEKQSPLHDALRHFSVQKTPFTLYQVTAPDEPATLVSEQPTGFEIGLA